MKTVIKKFREVSDRQYIKYLMISVLMMFFVILYVWQNIEVMKIKFEYRRTLDLEKNLVKENDRILYEIEGYKRMDIIEDYARKNNMILMSPADFGAIELKK